MNLPRFLAGRAITGAIVLWGAATLTFIMMHLTSGDTAVAILGGPDAMPTAEQIAAVRAEYGLDRPFLVQYGDWLWRLLHGDLGQSYRLRIPVSEAIADQLWPTIQLGLTSAALAFALAILSATLTVRRRRAWIGTAASVTELVFVAVPVFVIGIALLLTFAFYFPVLPVANATGLAGLALPALTLALPMAATLGQVLRQELEDVLDQPFILTARARGLSDLATRFGHALRHALMPVITLSGFFLAALMSSTAVTEALFSRPGVGRLLVDASNTTDVPVVVGITVLSALFYVIASVAVDLIGAVIDPRTVAR
ncbi:ABC transporter permease [Novosphingobium colocasiae]|uniref:ABC transporter permease n=1 Tax=Novosphingobium colocasiae TaxID=1256513 RepID=UPI0035ADA384